MPRSSRRKNRSGTREKPKVKPSSALQKPNWLQTHPLLTALGIFFILIMVFFFDTIFMGKTYVSPDAQAPASLSVPLTEYLWTNWEVPQWIPNIFGGMPSFSSLIFTPFAYFPDAILMVIERGVPIRRWLIYALHYVLAGFGIFLFLRHRKADFIPAITGGLAFMLTPYLITMIIFGHGSQIMTAAYIPIAFWATDRLFEKVSLLNIGLLGLTIGLMLQRGHVQISYYGLMLIGFYFLYQAVVLMRTKETPRLLKTSGGFAAGLVIALALAAILYLPLKEYTPFSIRGAASALKAPTGEVDTGVGFDYATQWSFSPGEMMTFIVPSYYGFGGVTYWGNMPFTDYPNYMGILVLALAIVALVQRVQLAGFFGISIILALLLSYGHHFAPFYKIFYNYFPYFNKFRVPVMILVLVQMLIAILAGLGMQSILQALTKKSNRENKQADAIIAKRLWIALSVLFGMAMILTFARDSFFEFMRGIYPDKYDTRTQLHLDTMRFDMMFGDMWIVVFILGGGLAMGALAYSKKISATLAASVVAILILTDLWLVDKKIGNDPVPEKSAKKFLEPDAATKFINKDSGIFRIYPTVELFGENSWAAQGIQTVGGYHAAKPRRYQDLLEATNLQSGFVGEYFLAANRGGRRVIQSMPIDAIPAKRRDANKKLMDMLNVKYLLSYYPLAEPTWQQRISIPLQQGTNQRSLFIYENKTVLPRAFLVGGYEVVANDLDILKKIRSGRFDPHNKVILKQEPNIQPTPDSTATATIAKYDLHEIIVEVESQFPQILVLSDNHFPAWQAYIDEQRVNTLLANYNFRAIEVPAGKHKVEFHYSSPVFTLGVLLSLGALAVSLGFIFIGWKKEKNL